MRKRTLGRTELRLSQITLGTWGLASGAYGPCTEEDFERTVVGALDEGITTFDVAPLWGDGLAERVVGRAVAERRDRSQLITRGGVVWKDGRVHRRFDPDALAADCEASLARLGTDHVDVWLLHNPPDPVLAQDDWAEVGARLKREGKTRAWGVSVGNADQARRALAMGADVLCLVYNLLAADDVDDLASDIAVAGCGVLGRTPLAYGLLTGEWAEDRTFPKEDHRHHRWTSTALRQRVRQVAQLDFLVHDDVPSLTAAALRFVLSNPSITSAMVGARNRQQVGSAAAAVRVSPRLPDDDLIRLPQVLAAAGV
jgi:aryl-alcohol dehydrogenase-like predicted oxidoreductase